MRIFKMEDQLKSRIRVACGKEKADLLIKNARVMDVFSGSIFSADVAIHGSIIIGFGDYNAREIIDIKGRFLCPGFIDGHIHVESSMVSVSEFARAVVPLGTTSIVADPHEIANVMGLEGIKYIAESGRLTPLDVYIMLPSCVPSTDMETSGARLSASDLLKLVHKEWVLGLGEVMNFPGVIDGDPEILRKIEMAKGKRIDGHAPMLAGNDLNAYISVGIGSDHECTTLKEAREKLQKGMYIMIREGTVAKNMETLLPLVTPANSRRCLFVTDDKHPLDLFEEGHMDFLIRKAVKQGLDPIIAVQMVTLNPAEYFHLHRLGAIAPGYKADITVFETLKDLRVEMVFKGGKLVARDGRLLELPLKEKKPILNSSLMIKDMDIDRLKIKASSENARIIELVPNQITTKKIIEKVRIVNGHALADIERDILKIAVIERHTGSGNVRLGFVRGFGLKTGAIGSSVAHDSHNIIVVGTNDDDMLKAVIEIEKIGGGQLVVGNGSILASLPLPIAGLMSYMPLLEVADGIKRLLASAKTLGCHLRDPFMALSFLALPVIPELKITDKGLVDVSEFRIVSLFE
ncbi:MAG: adenine deaminase [bacterium]|nr:MAG: adenine deaminase [bacterium]